MMGEFEPKITSIRVQSQSGEWFTYDNGRWSGRIRVPKYSSVYIAFYVAPIDSGADSMVKLKITTSHGTEVVVEKECLYMTLPHGEGVGLEMPSYPIGTFNQQFWCTVSIPEGWYGGPYEHRMIVNVETIEVVDPTPPVIPPVIPPQVKTCLLAAVCLPGVVLAFLRAAVRPWLPLWLTERYYRFSVYILNCG